MERIIVELPADRDFCGTLTYVDEQGQVRAGPFPVAARGSERLAAARGNATRNPLLRFGDTPLGTYRVRQILPSGNGTIYEASLFGPSGVIVIEAMEGDAALADANGRTRFFIAGGALAPDGCLRSGSGNLRLSNAHQCELLDALGETEGLRCEVIAKDFVDVPGTVYDDLECREEDPPPLPEQSTLRALFTDDFSRRDALRAGAAGAGGMLALSLSVSFVALDGVTRSASAAGVDMAYGAPPPPPAPTNPGQPEGGQLQPFPQGAPAQNLPPANPQGAAPANSAMQQLQNATSGHQTTGQTFDNGPGPSDATPTGNTSVPSVPQPTPATEPALTEQQQQILNQDTQYQQYQAQQSQAQKDAADAAARQQQIQQQLNSTTDSAQKGQLQVDLVKARQDESNANSAAAAAKINAEERKKTDIQGAPILRN
ncbi:MAG: hypothetical protein ABSD21_03605 [Rhizomicrobium sp.]|jgi:hypothetical protein